MGVGTGAGVGKPPGKKPAESGGREGAARYGDLTVAWLMAEAVKAQGSCDCGCSIGRSGLIERRLMLCFADAHDAKCNADRHWAEQQQGAPYLSSSATVVQTWASISSLVIQGRRARP